MPIVVADLKVTKCEPALRAKHLADIIQIMTFCEIYRSWTVADISRNIFPAIARDQTAIFYHKASAIGFVTWAGFDELSHESLVTTGNTPAHEKWNSGSKYWIIDFASPFLRVDKVRQRLKEEIFSSVDHCYGLRRNKDGSIRKIVRIGVNA